jgi:DNA-binding protein YbaB
MLLCFLNFLPNTFAIDEKYLDVTPKPKFQFLDGIGQKYNLDNDKLEIFDRWDNKLFSGVEINNGLNGIVYRGVGDYSDIVIKKSMSQNLGEYEFKDMYYQKQYFKNDAVDYFVFRARHKENYDPGYFTVTDFYTSDLNDYGKYLEVLKSQGENIDHLSENLANKVNYLYDKLLAIQQNNQNTKSFADIKSKNILVNYDGSGNISEMKIADAQFVDIEDSRMQAFIDTTNENFSNFSESQLNKINEFLAQMGTTKDKFFGEDYRIDLMMPIGMGIIEDGPLRLELTDGPSKFQFVKNDNQSGNNKFSKIRGYFKNMKKRCRNWVPCFKKPCS